jgi:hypothetical protein
VKSERFYLELETYGLELRLFERARREHEGSGKREKDL